VRVGVRIMTWNVHGLVGADRRRDPERIALVIREVRPDVAGLQEVGAPADPSGATHPGEALARLTGLASAFGPTVHRAGWAFGNAILSRFPIEAVRTYDLSVPGREPRGCLRADVVAEGGRIHFFAAHLGLDWREQRRQAAQLLSADILRDAALAHPLVLVGDFNAWSNRSAVPRWLRRQLVDCALAGGREAATFPAPFPFLRLDRAYVDGALEVRGYEVIHTRLARGASDHLPLVVDVAVRPSARPLPVARPVETAGVVTTVRSGG
jgi:endonuclease/exonuclease/phosphatase family metal-dependent hydrolase